MFGCWTALKIVRTVWHRRKLNVRYIHINIWWHLNCNVICSKNFITPNILILFEYSIGWSTFNGIHILFVLHISNVGWLQYTKFQLFWHNENIFNYFNPTKPNLGWIGSQLQFSINFGHQLITIINHFSTIFCEIS